MPKDPQTLSNPQQRKLPAPPDKHPHMVEVSTKGSVPIERYGELVDAVYSRQDTMTGKIFDYYPRYRLVDARVQNEHGGWVPAKVEQVTWMRRARKGQRDPFASMGVRAIGEEKK